MHGKALFLRRAVSRTDEWGPRFPALSMASHQADSISGGRQIAIAVTDAEGMRCAVFTSFGAILDFRTSWSELERAATWWHYTRAWHFWFVDTEQSARRLFPANTALATVASSIETANPKACCRSLLTLIQFAERRAALG
ncbi:hypothetical protein C2U71_26630 [Burkholderia ubonensis]|nr:hypothetical protein C2U71_26630 [Burkholderia ubonensis]